MKEQEKTYWWPDAKKLIFLQEMATPDYWDREWETDDWQRKVTGSRGNRSWHRLLRLYLPDTDSRILEGGCGCGHLVDAMQHWSYEAIGVDYARETVTRLKDTMPALDVRHGDVRALDFTSDYFDGYLSLGVIEHFWEGYEDILHEAHRTLKRGGYFFLSFPCISPLERVRIKLSGYELFTGTEMPGNFFQFGLDIRNVRADCERIGFEYMRSFRQYGLSGVQRVFPSFKHASDRLWEITKHNVVAKAFVIGLSRVLQPLCGLSAMLVLRKR